MIDIAGIKARFEKHRKEAMITCPEDCPCWDVEIIATALTDHEAAIAAKDAECLDLYRLNEKLTAENYQLWECVKVNGLTHCIPTKEE